MDGERAKSVHDLTIAILWNRPLAFQGNNVAQAALPPLDFGHFPIGMFGLFGALFHVQQGFSASFL
jgi:hypothetical protein